MAESNPNPTAGSDNERGKGEGRQVELLNDKRHKHELLRVEGLLSYKCSGCEEYGANIGYKCKIGYDSSSSSCHNFTLHEHCATLPHVYQHPIRSDVSLEFRPNTLLRHHCSACMDVLKGYVFETKNRDLRLHPLCVALPKILDFGGHAHHKLKLKPGKLKEAKHTCSACDTEIETGCWRYKCEEVACPVTVDLSCAKIDIHGLSDYGIDRIAPDSRSRHLRKSVGAFGKGLKTAVGLINGLGYGN